MFVVKLMAEGRTSPVVTKSQSVFLCLKDYNSTKIIITLRLGIKRGSKRVQKGIQRRFKEGSKRVQREFHIPAKWT